MQWSQDDGSIVERREPVRWRGRVEGGIGGTFHIRNNYGDSLTFVKQPFVWHFFLSHIQREARDYCSMMATRMADLSVRGKRIRTWYDNAAAVVNKEAMALGITHSQVFILFLTPSVFKSVYVAFEIKTALELRKPIILVVREDAVTPEGGSLFDALQAEAPSELAAVFSRAVAVLRFPCTAAGSTDTDDFMRQLMTAGGFAGNIAPAT